MSSTGAPELGFLSLAEDAVAALTATHIADDSRAFKDLLFAQGLLEVWDDLSGSVAWTWEQHDLLLSSGQLLWHYYRHERWASQPQVSRFVISDMDVRAVKVAKMKRDLAAVSSAKPFDIARSAAISPLTSRSVAVASSSGVGQAKASSAKVSPKARDRLVADEPDRLISVGGLAITADGEEGGPEEAGVADVGDSDEAVVTPAKERPRPRRKGPAILASTVDNPNDYEPVSIKKEPPTPIRAKSRGGKGKSKIGVATASAPPPEVFEVEDSDEVLKSRLSPIEPGFIYEKDFHLASEYSDRDPKLFVPTDRYSLDPGVDKGFTIVRNSVPVFATFSARQSFLRRMGPDWVSATNVGFLQARVFASAASIPVPPVYERMGLMAAMEVSDSDVEEVPSPPRKRPAPHRTKKALTTSASFSRSPEKFEIVVRSRNSKKGAPSCVVESESDDSIEDEDEEPEKPAKLKRKTRLFRRAVPSDDDEVVSETIPLDEVDSAFIDKGKKKAREFIEDEEEDEMPFAKAFSPNVTEVEPEETSLPHIESVSSPVSAKATAKTDEDLLPAEPSEMRSLPLANPPVSVMLGLLEIPTLKFSLPLPLSPTTPVAQLRVHHDTLIWNREYLRDEVAREVAHRDSFQQFAQRSQNRVNELIKLANDVLDVRRDIRDIVSWQTCVGLASHSDLALLLISAKRDSDRIPKRHDETFNDAETMRQEASSVGEDGSDKDELEEEGQAPLLGKSAKIEELKMIEGLVDSTIAIASAFSTGGSAPALIGGIAEQSSVSETIQESVSTIDSTVTLLTQNGGVDDLVIIGSSKEKILDEISKTKSNAPEGQGLTTLNESVSNTVDVSMASKVDKTSDAAGGGEDGQKDAK
ncbi:hypothetical protein DXG01_005770 [Tephrocybe rancida]|nr:hypothetical protein DXG01_005770 [Tephrocybe rancida]